MLSPKNKEVIDHAENTIKDAKNHSESQIQILDILEFVTNEFVVLQEQYEENLMKLTQRFQSMVFKHQFDEKVLQYFQLVSNSLLWVASQQERMIKDLNSNTINLLKEKAHKYKATNISLINGTSKVIKELKENRKKLLSSQGIYYKKCEDLEKVQRDFDDLDKSHLNIGPLQTKLNESKFSEQEAMTTYYMQMGNTNKMWDLMNKRLPSFLIDFLVNEMAKNDIIYSTVKQFVGTIYTYQDGSQFEKESKISKTQVNKVFENYPLSEVKILDIFNEDDVYSIKEKTREEFEDYDSYVLFQEFWSDREVSSLVAKLDKESTEIDPIHHSQIKKLVELIFSNAKEQELKFDIYEFFKSEINQKVFIHNLLLRKYQKNSNTVEISGFSFKCMLISLQFICLSFLEGKKSIELLYDIIKIASSIYHFKGDRKEFLIENLNKLAVWSEKKIWIQLFRIFCESQKNRGKKPSNTENIIGVVGKFFKPNKPRNIVYDTKVTKLAFEDFSSMLFNIKFNYEIIAETLMTVADNYKIEKRFVCKILRKNEDRFTQELYDRLDEVDVIGTLSVRKRARSIILDTGVWEYLLPFLEFLDCVELLCLSKKHNDQLRMPLYRSVLMDSSIQLQRDTRETLWVKFILDEYKHLKINDESILTENDHDDDVILLDVKRTYPNNKNFDKNILIKILRGIKVEFSTSICYYQGLNYFVAFLMLNINDYDLVLQLSCSLLKTTISRYVKEDLSDLKKAYYALNRLIQKHLPHIADRFKKENITVDVFCSPWFLTIFGTVGQYQKDPDNLVQIWDIFIADHWVGFYKVLLCIIKLFEERILESSYEEIMTMFFDLMKSEIFNGTSTHKEGEMSPLKPIPKSAGLINFKSLIKSQNLHEEDIAKFEIEYYQIVKQMDDFWKNYEEKTQPLSN